MVRVRRFVIDRIIDAAVLLVWPVLVVAGAVKDHELRNLVLPGRKILTGIPGPDVR